MARVKSNGLPWPLTNKKVVGRGGGAPGSRVSNRDGAGEAGLREAKVAKEAKEHMKKFATKYADGGKVGAQNILKSYDEKQSVATSKYRERGRSKMPTVESSKWTKKGS